LQLGESPVVAAELYWPLDERQRWFIAPQARLSIRNVPILSGQQLLGEFRVRSFDAGIDVGREFGNWGELRIGAHLDRGRSRIRIGAPAQPPDRFEIERLFARFSYDVLDDVNFPRFGQTLAAEWRTERSRLGNRDRSDQVIVDGLIARSAGRNTATVWLSAGSNLDAVSNDPRNLFSLGGFLNLSGLRADSITGPHFAIARAMYYRKIGKGGEGFLNVPTYVGLALEAGNVWNQRGDISVDSARSHASLFLGLDTLFGPVYLGGGVGEGGDNAFYLFLGRTF
jgi:NTE family protein